MGKILVTAMVLVSVAFLATGCANTMHGAGRDIERAGQKIQESF